MRERPVRKGSENYSYEAARLGESKGGETGYISTGKLPAPNFS